MAMDRRRFLADVAKGLAVVGASALAPRLVRGATPDDLASASLPSGTVAETVLHALPGKRPLLKRTYRPPNYETPVEMFNDAFTPNDAFFVRYHHSLIPEVSREAWRLRIGGDAVGKTFELGFDDLVTGFESVEIPALCFCSGNRRGFSTPHVPGIEWGHGAMGNARWKGVRLKDVLVRAGVKKDAVEVAMSGADAPLLATTPVFAKSIPVWKALDESTLLAFEMNGAPLPHWNGFPVRVVVPGWTATYWMKQVNSLDVISQPLQSFWMKTAYRIPKGKFALVDRFLSQESEASTPITEMVVGSLITNVKQGQRLRLGERLEVKGVAWDGGYGMRMVEVSTDDGESWRPASLGMDLGRYSWRQWSYAFQPARAGSHTILARAMNRIGSSQTLDLNFNPAGYHNNVVQRIEVQVA